MFAKKHMITEVSMDKTTVRQLFDMFKKRDMVVVGFIAMHESGGGSARIPG